METDISSLLHYSHETLLLFVWSDSSALLIYSLVLLLLLFLSALISGSEVAFFSLTHNDFAVMEEENSKSGSVILKLKEKPRTLLATILIANNFINIAIVLVYAKLAPF